jgi:hypothetical protein
MKKIVTVFVLAICVGVGSIVAAAAGTARGGGSELSAASYSAQIGQVLFPRRNRRWGNSGRNGRVRYETVTVYKGRKVYRDTYKITYKNGREKRKRVERVRVA